MSARISDHRRCPPTMPKARPDVLVAELDQDLVLYDPVNRSSFRLNHTARAVWLCCDGSTTVDEIAEDLAAVYKADPQTVSEQVHRLVAYWAAQGLFSAGPAATT